MADPRIPSDAEPCLDFGRIMRIIRERIDGRNLELVGYAMSASRSTLARIEVGDTPPEKVTDRTIESFLDAVVKELNFTGQYQKKRMRFKQLIYCLYKAYDCHQDRMFERNWEQVKGKRKLRKYGRS